MEAKKSPHEEILDTPRSLEVFSQKILVILLFMGGLYMLYLLSGVLSILFFSLFLTILFSPVLEKMGKKGVPDWLGIILIFLGIFLFFFVVLFAIVPIFVKQITLLTAYISSSFGHMESLYRAGGIDALGFPSFLQSYIKTVDFGTFFELIRNNFSSISTVAGSLSKNILESSTSIISSLSGGIFQMAMIVVFTFFMGLERRAIKEFLYAVFPRKISSYLRLRENSFLRVLGAWFRGQLILSLAIFSLTLTGLFALKLFGIQVESIFTLALIAGLMEFIPYIGPFFALLPALAIVAGMGLTPVVAVLVLYILIQQAENNILVPMVMSKTLDLSPFLILLMMTVMASLFGVIGILLSIPFTALFQIIVKDYLETKKRGEKEEGKKIAKKKDTK